MGLRQAFKDWLRARWERQEVGQFNKGYDFAVNQLAMRADAAVPVLEGYTDSARAFGCYDAFDRGIDRALAEWRLTP